MTLDPIDSPLFEIIAMSLDLVQIITEKAEHPDCPGIGRVALGGRVAAQQVLQGVEGVGAQRLTGVAGAQIDPIAPADQRDPRVERDDRPPAGDRMRLCAVQPDQRVAPGTGTDKRAEIWTTIDRCKIES